MKPNFTPESRRQVAGALGLNEQYLYQVLTGRRAPSPELCSDIERETHGAVMRWDLRPDDWRRIWPELLQRPDAPIEVRDAA